MVKKSTRVTLAPPLAVAVAVSATGVPTTNEVPVVGLVNSATGGTLVDVRLTTDEIAVAPFESVTLAVSEMLPGEVGVQTTEKGADVAVPRIVEPERNCTCVTLAPVPGVALAANVTGEPTVTTVPIVGAVIATVGDAPVSTETVTGADKVALPLSSTASARRT